jgi:hypothetical protein
LESSSNDIVAQSLLQLRNCQESTLYADNSAKAVHQGNDDDAGGQSLTEIERIAASLTNNIDTVSAVRSADNAGAHSSTIHQAQ